MNVDETLIERGTRYGSYAENAKISQTIKAAMMETPNWDALAPDMRESLQMIAGKVARILNGDPEHHDSWHDIGGYARLVADRLS